RADVLVENFRPGAMARLGYAWEDLADRYPSLVYASISGFGQTGPMSGQAAYDAVVQALGGIMSVTGPAGGEPTRVGTSIADLGGGLFGAVGILAALVERAATGRGRRVDVAMLDGQVALLENALARLGATGVAPGPGGGHHPSIAPFGTFAAADGQIVLAAGNDELFRRCCAALGAPALAADDRFLTNVERCLHRDELVAALEAILAGSGVERWLADLEAAGVPCAAVRDVGQLATDPQVAARRMLVKLEGPPGHPLSGLTVAGNPVKLSGVHDPATRPLPPALDQHRDAILAELEAAEEGATGA
ncbi:MAG: CaiB/BaiF CoA transferase family protein, partial [Acidimicrobiales bacterium]